MIKHFALAEEPNIIFGQTHSRPPIGHRCRASHYSIFNEDVHCFSPSHSVAKHSCEVQSNLPSTCQAHDIQRVIDLRQRLQLLRVVLPVKRFDRYTCHGVVGVQNLGRQVLAKRSSGCLDASHSLLRSAEHDRIRTGVSPRELEVRREVNLLAIGGVDRG
jgi:hypothetical protein